MALVAGTRVGAYEILTAIGAGGMGEVYRAKDTKLGRHVALKILPASFTNDPERVARFRREAQVLASLNHPHIAQIHGLEEVDGTQFLVLELVDGESLDKRIARGPISVDEALAIARQIAEALEAAHEKGIIHRDLKPANIALTNDGQVKVLDFGLAKAVETKGASVDAMTSPTITSPAMMTGVGVILGTAAYMSPEQAKGRPADKRSDVWAFGCVLYEMLAGQRAFEGEDISETLAAVLRAEVDLTLLPHGTPQAVRRLLRRTFAKNPADRLRDVGDARLDLNGSALEPSDARGADHGSSWLRHQVAAVPWIVALIALIVASRLAMRAPVPAARPVIRFRVVMPPDSALSVGPNLFQLVVALSPDGTKLAYIALEENNTTTLHVHSMDRLDSVSLQDTSGATAPFFSPDGQWIGFSAAGLLRKIAVNGGAPVTICEPGSARGATWLPDDTIVFTPATGAGLLRVPSSGGKPVVVADPNAPDEQSLRYPDSLPGGRALLFTIQRHTGDFNSAAIGVLRLDTGERRVLLEGGSSPHYVPDGHMAFVRAGSVFVVPFDVSTLSVKGTPVPVIDGVLFSPNQGTAQFAVSGTGSAVYVAGRVAQGSQTLVWVDRHGVVETVPAPAQNYEFPRLSPDGRQIAVSINGSSAAGLRDVWLYDLARHTLSRLTFEKEEAETPLWTPDGKRVTYALQRSGRREFAWKLADGSAQEDVFVPTDQHFHLGAWSPDGERLVAAATESGVDAGSLWLLELKPKPTVRPLLKTQRAAQAPAISPDGNWLAYSANDTNRFEIYVQAFPGPGGKYQISTEGGVEPRWNPNGRELFYRSGNKMMAVSVRTSGNTFESDTPQLLFDGKFTVMDGAHDAWYDVARDGQRFLMMRRTDAQNTTDMVVIHDWSSELATRVPSK